MDGHLTHLHPQSARHSSSSAVLASLDVVEVRHLPVEEGVTDGAGRVLGGQHDDAFALDEPGVEAGARGPGGEVGREPYTDDMDLDFGEAGFTDNILAAWCPSAAEGTMEKRGEKVVGLTQRLPLHRSQALVMLDE